MSIKIFIFLILSTVRSQYNINLNYPFLLDNAYSNITAINWYYRDGFSVAFQNKQVRRYSWDFSTYNKFNVTDIVQYISTIAAWYSSNQLSNGTVWSTNVTNSVTFSNNFRTFKLYNYTTLGEIQSYTFNQKILLHWGIPQNFFDSTITHNVLICNQTVRVIYKGVVQSILNFSQVYQPGTVCDSAFFYQYTLTSGQDFFKYSHTFYVTISTKEVLNLTTVLTFNINFNSSTFDMTCSLNPIRVTDVPQRISRILYTNYLILMQSNSTGEIYLYDIRASKLGAVDINIPKNQTFSFFRKFNNYYLLQSYGLIKISFNSSLSKIFFVSTISLLPYNTYSLVIGKKIDILYIPNTPYIYKVGKCMNQSIYDGVSSCEEYSCQSQNCAECSMSSTICSVCKKGFTQDENYQCNLKDQFILTGWMMNVLVFFLQLLKKAISIPGARKIVTPLFYYFGNFDDLFLYSLHGREYGDTMNRLFQQISEIEAQKWSLISFKQLCGLVRIDATRVVSALQFQDEYLRGPSSQDSMGFFANCTNFLLVELPTVLLAFMLLRLLFRKLSRYAVSQLLRRFDFWVYFALIIFEGNVQQFSFYVTAELRAVFVFVWNHKPVKVFTVLFGFALTLFSVCGYIVAFTFYRRLNRYFTDNNKNVLQGNSFLILQSGLRNMVLGVFHSILIEGSYYYLITTLILVQATFFFIFLIGVSSKVYIEQAKIWIYLIFTLLRIFLIFALALDVESINYPLFELIEQVLIFFMVFLTLLSTLFLIGEGIQQFRRLIFRKRPKRLPLKHANFQLLIPPQSPQNKVDSKIQAGKATKKTNGHSKKQQQAILEQHTWKIKGIKILFQKSIESK